MRGRIFCAASASIKTAKSVRAQSNAKFMQIQNLYFFTCDLHRALVFGHLTPHQPFSGGMGTLCCAT